MVETSVIANEIRKHIAEGATETVLIAIIAHLADLYPDMTVAQLSAALQEARQGRIKPHKPDSPIG